MIKAEDISPRGARRAVGALVALAATLGLAAGACALEAKEVRSQLRVRVGEKSPDFTLVASDGKTVKLSAYAGHAVLLDFYRAYW